MIKKNVRKCYLTKTLSFVFIAALIICMAGCFNSKPFKYEGEYPELYSVAITNLLDADGYIHGEIRFDPRIEFMEEDEYGRRLFLYYESKTISEYSLMVVQKSDDKYSYYYPDYNFVSAPEEGLVLEKIDELKSKNDWGLPIDKYKCIKTEIVREKTKGPVRKLEGTYKKVLGEDAYNNVAPNIVFLTIDDYNRSIYLFSGEGRANEDNSEIPKRYIVVLFQPDGSIDESAGIFELTDIYDYQDELKDFKTANGWNMPVN